MPRYAFPTLQLRSFMFSPHFALYYEAFIFKYFCVLEREANETARVAKDIEKHGHECLPVLTCNSLGFCCASCRDGAHVHSGTCKQKPFVGGKIFKF